MDITIDEMVDQIDVLMDVLVDRDDMFLALELAQQLRDELIRHSDGYDDEE